MPNLFFAVAPAEWKVPLLHGIFGDNIDAGNLSDFQPKTLHVYHCMAEITQNILLSKKICHS